MNTLSLKNRLNDTILNIPDFPKPGIQFKDISPVFLDPALYKDIISDFCNFSRGKIDAVCGIESRGFLFGISIAVELGIPFILVRKKGKLPPPFVAQKYDLEYGSAEIEMREDQILPGMRVLVHDDLLATGGTTEATAKLIQKQGGIVAQFSFLIGLKDLCGKQRLEVFSKDIYSIVEY